MLVSLVTTAAVATGCGVPDDERPRVIGGDQAYVDLSPTTAPIDDEGDDTITVFFLDRSSGRSVLAPARRTVTAATPQTAMEQLLLGPQVDPADPDDTEAGLVSAIPPGTSLPSSSVMEGTLELDFASSEEAGLLDIEGESQLAAFAQIVRTMTGLSGVRNVRFLIDGQPVDAPTSEGQPTSDPVDRDDYISLAPGSDG